ncbi:MAG TPA: hypothetical protein VFQ53_37035 [Kofleriaceae bacterium]|nr:hypothetical protein [Kofleriaceae bacterium]
MRASVVIVSSLALALAACGGSQKDVAVRGDDSDLVKLAGEWEGEYQGLESGRAGKVRFSLQLGRHTAEGEVFMGAPDGKVPLKIQFVQVAGGELKGTIAPYTDPNCNCQVETSFMGRLANDTVSGRFETKIQDRTQTGSWRVTRKAAAN